ncbi:MAG: phosphatase PAP2 family protein [Bacteroidota bacterium]
MMLLADMNNWWQEIINWDILLEQHINQQWVNPALDFMMPLLRTPINWLPLYLLFIFWLVKKYRQQSLSTVIMLLLLILFTDTISAQVLKPMINRLRPCWDENTASTVRMLTGCGGRYSFPSNHAANHFALAMFLFLTIQKLRSKNWWLLFAWAVSICYAQIYVGKHFPLDVIGGATIGCILAWLFFIGGNRLIVLFIANRSRYWENKKHFMLDDLA